MIQQLYQQFQHRNNMRSHPLNPDRNDLFYAENIESYLQARAYSRDAIPKQNDTQHVEKLLQALNRYKPISDLLDMGRISNGSGLEIKRYKESAYWGETQESKRHGQGVLLYANGRVYEGNWSANLRNGKGFEKFSNGSTYKGTYVNGKPEGCGRYEWENGEIYEGQWKNGVKHGSGIWRGSKGDSYIGQWQEGKAQGYGVHTWTNGDRYEGEFKNCLKHGEGIERFSNGDTYKGLYELGKPSGYGEYYWASGSFFKGNFKAGFRSGQGIWKKGPGKSDKYEGEWLEDKKNGYGVFTWAQGNIYKGHYLNDLKEGYGELFYTDGAIYRGNWSADQQTDAFQKESIEHDQDCELFVPSNTPNDYPMEERLTDNGQYYLEQGILSQPKPLYRQPQQPAVLRSASRNFRPRNLTKNSSRTEQRPRAESQGGKVRLMAKKMSVGTVAGKLNPYKISNEKMLSSSFFLYKMQGQQQPKSGTHLARRQVRTSGTSRGKQVNLDEELKHFARSKIGSYSQLQ